MGWGARACDDARQEQAKNLHGQMKIYGAGEGVALAFRISSLRLRVDWTGCAGGMGDSLSASRGMIPFEHGAW